MTQAVAVLVGLLSAATLVAEPAVKVSLASVSVFKKAGKDWCLLDARASVEVASSPQALAAVLENYETYPTLFPKIREAKVERVTGAVLLTEKVVVSALGIENVNRFTLRITRSELPQGGILIAWTEHSTDGTIADLLGSWTLDNLGTREAPRTRVAYHSRSSVPVVVWGQDAFLRMFLGSETRAAVEAVVKRVLSR